MSEYVLRTIEQLTWPAVEVVETDENGFGTSKAWFWYEHEAREYMNLKEACAKKDAALRAALEWLDEDEAPKLQEAIKEALK